MTSLYEILKASKGVLVNDMYTALFGRAVGGGSGASEIEYTGSVPVAIKADGSPIIAYRISGNLVQTGTPTPDNPIQPQETGERTGNLFDYQTMAVGETGKALNAQGQVQISSNWNITDYIPVDGDKFVLSKVGGVSFAICFYGSNKNFIEGIAYATGGADRKSDIFCDISQTANYARFSYIAGGTAAYDDVTTLMLNTGSTALPYEPYGYKLPVLSGGVTTPVYLSEPLRKIGDYADKVEGDTVTRVVKKLVLTENLVWSFSTSGSHNRAFLTDWRGALGNSLPLCTHYEGVNGGGSYPTEGRCLINVNGTPIFNADFVADKTEWLAYLQQQYAAGTPVTVWYVLATPTTEAITAPTIPTINGEQTFDVDTTLKPSEVYIKYKGEA